MKWSTLYKRIGKQPKAISQTEDVKLKLSVDEWYELKLVYTRNGSRFHFELGKVIEND